MKKFILVFICLFLLNFVEININKIAAQENKATGNTLSIVSTPDLYNLTKNWANEFSKQNPNVKIEVIKFDDTKLSGICNTGADLCFVSNEAYAILDNNKLWKIEVGKDALVPILNSKNPFLPAIREQNISPVILAQVLLNPENRKWNVFPKIEKNAPINYYMVNDQSEDLMIAKFLSTNQTIEGIRVENNEKMIAAIQKDPYSIGFCKLSILLNSNNLDIYNDIAVMPLDKNKNGKIDGFENVYADLQTFIRKAWIGKYPKELTGSIYSIALQKPAKQVELEFLSWISTDGQQFLNDNGYSALVSSEKESNLAVLGSSKNNVAISEETSLFSSITQFFSSFSASQYGFVLFIIIMLVFIRLLTITPKNNAVVQTTGDSLAIFDENILIVPTGIFFDKTHTWAFMEKDGMVKIGIDDFLQHITGRITKVKMKNPGDLVRKGEAIVSIIQNGKLLNINSPVSGTIRAQNETLIENPSTINQSPYSNGWVYTIEPSNWIREIQFFTMAGKYREWIKNEFSRLKDFLAITINSKMPEYAHVMLQDGGTVKDNVLADLGPDVWEEFQINFIDTMK